MPKGVHNKFVFSLVLGILLVTIQVLRYDTAKAANKLYNKKNSLDSLNQLVNQFFDNEELSWEEILRALENVKRNTKSHFGSPSKEIAFIIHKQGVVYYNMGLEGDLDNFYKAIDCYQEAIRLRKKINQAGTLTPDIIRGYGNIAGCYRKSHQPYLGIKAVSAGLQIADQYHLLSKNTALYFELSLIAARLYDYIGDYEFSLKYYLSIIQGSKDETSTALKIRALLESGGIFANKLDQPNKAIAHLLLAEKELSIASNTNHTLLGLVHYYLGIAYEKTDNKELALIHTNKAISLNRKTNNQNILAHAYINLGILLKKKYQLDEAEILFHKAQNILTEWGEKFDLSYVYDNLSDIAFLRKNFTTSLALDNLALQCLIPEFKPTKPEDNPTLIDQSISDKQGLLITLESKAESLIRRYQTTNHISDLLSAYTTFQLLDHLIARIRSEYSSDLSKLWLAKTAKKIYEKAIETSQQLYSINHADSCFQQAFEYSEKSRAIILLDALRKSHIHLSLNKALFEEIRSINIKVNFFEKEVALQQNEKITSALLDSLLIYRRLQQNKLRYLEKNYPTYHELVYNQQTISVPDVRKRLANEESLLEYFVGDSALFIFVIQKDTSFVAKSNFPPHLEMWVHQFNQGLAAVDQSFLNPGHKLYQILLEPIKYWLPQNQKLTIIPDGILSTISIEALPTKSVVGTRVYFPAFKNYVLFEHLINYAFSASTLYQSANKTEATKSFLGMAPTFSEGFSMNNTFFDKLSWNIHEVEMLEDKIPGDLFLGDQATRSAFMNQAHHYKLIHLATHALANGIQGDLSFIAFGTDSTQFVYTKDLYSLHLNADMVVLSACQTSSGSFHEGEGVISLARGFIYSGAASVITSLWNVREKANNEIMVYFYDEIKNGLPKDRALRNSKLKFLQSIHRENQQRAHPYFWAALISLGNPSPLSQEENNSFILYAAFSCILALTCWFFIRKISLRLH